MCEFLLKKKNWKKLSITYKRCSGAIHSYATMHAMDIERQCDTPTVWYLSPASMQWFLMCTNEAVSVEMCVVIWLCSLKASLF